jgi:hypothetical protein|tara:strand:- start:811 stop:1137 length:327 start_codon:yes stop_codon:yes gene_type:complete
LQKITAAIGIETCAGVGAMVCEETFSLEMSAETAANYDNSKTTGNDDNQFFENSVSETFSTSAYNGNPGPPATAFLIPTLSMVFSMAKFVEYDSQTCNPFIRNDAGKL